MTDEMVFGDETNEQAGETGEKGKDGLRLTDISTVRALMEKHGITFRKEFGQNFLINPSVLERIAAQAEGNVLEIGPGIGSLTRELAKNAEKVVCVEIDRGLIPVLGETLGDCPNVTVINADVMKVGLPEFLDEHFGSREYSVCANLPYNITTPVLMKLCETEARPRSVTVMIQKEVARRLSAPAGSPEYGAVTAALSYYGTVRRLFDVTAGNFLPAPKVDSTVIRIDMHPQPPVPVRDEKLLFSVIRAAFGERRKTLLNALSSGLGGQFTKEETAEAIGKAEIDPRTRGETLSLERFAAVADALAETAGQREKRGDQ